MHRSRFTSGTAQLAVILLCLVPTLAARAADEPERLNEAIRLFNAGDYVAAQELLAEIDRSQLSPEQQQSRDDYLSRVQIALTMYEKAIRDLEDAENAINSNDLARAEELLNQVLKNEYAAEALRRDADQHLRDLSREGVRDAAPARSEAVQAAVEAGKAPPEEADRVIITETETIVPIEEIPPPHEMTPADVDQARALTAAGNSLLREGRNVDAIAQFEAALDLVPGYPEAVDGIIAARQHTQIQAGPAVESLAERIRREDQLRWQRTEVQYRDAERIIREHVAAERFEEANQMLVRAQQLVESGKQFADPPTQYENLRAELDALLAAVRTEERAYHERRVAETRREVEEQRAERIRQVEENRARQVEALMQQAVQHRKDGDLDAAINVLRQVTVIDPKHKPARWMMDILEDERQYKSAGETRKLIYEKTRGALEDVEEAKIPWYEEITYPEDWAAISSRPGRGHPGEARADRLLLSALDRPTSVDFSRVPFDQVVEQLAQRNQLNIIVNWNDLQRAGVVRTTPIDLRLPNEISLKKVLSEVLDQAGGGAVRLGFDVADGAISVATQQSLDSETFPRVYDITDLLMDVPNFTDAPMTDLRDATPRPRPATEASTTPWNDKLDGADEREEDPIKRDRVEKLINLIEDTVAPDSWRNKGGSIGQIKEINGQLVITQNAANQRHISGLLDRLREERAIQVSVEALFITVSSHYLEQLGIDLDVVLNAGNAGFDFLDSGAGPVTDPVTGSRLLLPRTFSRIGETPVTPGIGTPLATPGGQVNQPFTQPFLVPQPRGGSGSNWTPIPISTNVLGLTDTANLPSDVPGSFGGQPIAPALNIFGSFLDNIQVDFLIRATQADSRTSVLTAPRLVVFNGGSAWIAVTIQQNFISQLQPVVAQGAVAQAPITGTIDAGASLFVRATVTADKRYVMMLLAPGVTRLLDLQTFQFSGGTGALQAFIQLPTLSSQRIQTMVSVPDGGTLLIGGQKLASETEVEAGVPILSKIPVLKRLYSSRSMVKDEQTLLVLIKPRILIHSEQEDLAFPSFSQR